MKLSFERLKIYVPNLLTELVVLVTALGVSVFQGTRALLAILASLLFIAFLPQLKINKFTYNTYFLIVVCTYFFLSAYIFENSSSLYLFKDFVYLILFDLFFRSRVKYSKSVFNIVLFISILTIILNQFYHDRIIGSYSQAFGVPRILSISVSTLSLFLLFKNIRFMEKIYIVLATLITFSAASYAILFIYFLKSRPLYFAIGFAIFVLSFNFDTSELYQSIKKQKEYSIENKINDSNVEYTEKKYETAEVLSVELYQNSGIIFASITSIFLILYIYGVSKNLMFTIFSWILISSNPTPLILILIIGNILKVTNYEN